MKTRVVKKKGKFIPQYKPLGASIWKEIDDKSFDTMDAAQQHIIDQFD